MLALKFMALRGLVVFGCGWIARRFEDLEVYPFCVGADIDLIGEQMAHRRNQLLESFNTE